MPSASDLDVEDSPFRPSREMRPNYQTYSGPSVPQLAGTQSDQLDMSFPDFHDMLHGKTSPAPLKHAVLMQTLRSPKSSWKQSSTEPQYSDGIHPHRSTLSITMR